MGISAKIIKRVGSSAFYVASEIKKYFIFEQ